MHLRQLDPYKSRLTDRNRLRAYRRAIQLTCPGQVVCDLYAGLGEHTLLALKAGARRVYAVEADTEVLRVTTDLVRAHGFGPDRFLPINADPATATLPETADVVILGKLDPFGISAASMAELEGQRARVLAPGGTFLPRTVRSQVAAATSLAWAADRLFWLDELGAEGLDYRLVAELIRQRPHRADMQEQEILSDWAVLQDVVLDRPTSFRDPAPVVLEVARTGTVTGLVHAFSAGMCRGVTWDTHPDQRPRQVGFTALRAPVEVARGDLLYAEVNVESGDGSLPVGMSVVHIEAARAGAFRQALAERQPLVAQA